MGLSGGLVEEVSDPKYSTGVGLVLYGMRHDVLGGTPLSEEVHQNGTANGETLMTRIADRMKSWFDEL
jgi:cell division protein FtsA